jgi:rRNA maturation RNase YbeY
MAIAVSCRTAAGVPWRGHVRSRGRQILRALALGAAELSVALVGDPEMRILNRTYRRRDRSTDVLAFPAGDDAPRAARMPVVLGDVVISIDTAALQARADRTSVAARLDALLIHGVLHLIGYDHEISPTEARRMSRRAREVRTAIGPAATVGARRPRRPARGAATGARLRADASAPSRARARTRSTRRVAR